MDLRDYMDRYCRWGHEGYMSSYDRAFGVGQQTLRALTHHSMTSEFGAVDRGGLILGN